MRNAVVFAGSSHPELVQSICERLNLAPGKCTLGQFSNGETSVKIGTSVREKSVFIVQSGSPTTNDSLMELLIMIGACKGGSAHKITAIMPYFSYSRQSKKKGYRGSITARLVANLLGMAGISHMVTLDLHSDQSKGFFAAPVDNLSVLPLMTNWIRQTILDYERVVAVSKNPGGSKRATSLADALNVDFAIITTARKRWNLAGSSNPSPVITAGTTNGLISEPEKLPEAVMTNGTGEHHQRQARSGSVSPETGDGSQRSGTSNQSGAALNMREARPGAVISPVNRDGISRAQALPSGVSRRPPTSQPSDGVDQAELPRHITTGRLVQGRIVDNDYPIPSSVFSSSANLQDLQRSMTSSLHSDRRLSRENTMNASFMSTGSSVGGFGGAGGRSVSDEASEDEEDELLKPDIEHEITLVGNVQGRDVLIIDDIVDKPASWIAAAEGCVKMGGASGAYLLATHGIFAGGEGLEELEQCECIKKIVVTNSFPIPRDMVERSSKLVILDVSALLAEAIRRNHYGESMCGLGE